MMGMMGARTIAIAALGAFGPGCALVLDWDYRVVAGPADAGADARAIDAPGADGTTPGSDAGAADGGCDPGSCPPRATSIAAGAFHTCITDDRGRVWCWGDNASGQCGLDPSTIVVTEPQLVIASGAMRVAAGAQHSCALTSGGLYCWGENTFGELGVDSMSMPRAEPQLVDMVAPLELAAGDSFSCIIRASSNVACIGTNMIGQLARGTMDAAMHATLMNGVISGAEQLALGDHHGCAIRGDDQAVCWASNSSGQLGRDSMATFETTVAPVAGKRTFAAIAAGPLHTCAVELGTGRLWCWGSNDRGQLGTRDTTLRRVPAGVVDLEPVATGPEIDALGLGLGHSCAIAAADRRVLCWGANTEGQLGLGDTMDRRAPERLDGPTAPARVVAVTAGNYHTCALDESGAIDCWGGNGRGQLARPTSSARSDVPLRIEIPD